EALIGQYAHGNEPSHHITWLYAWTDAPHKGQRLREQIVRRFYGTTPGGLVGNADVGQMSAWLVFAMLGFYPAEPF
ncbi:glycoside hydrolase domain-containing protein, partial [Acinetobacter baumannii]